MASDGIHHAYLLVGDSRAGEEFLHLFWQERSVMLIGSPDFFRYPEPLFGVDEARKLSEQAIRRAFGGKKIFFIAPERMTFEAQNALLKTFEEPIPDTHFFLVSRDAESILPTLRSRMQILVLETRESAHEAEEFLNLPLKKRLAFAKDFADEERNLPAFLDDLLSHLRAKKFEPEPIRAVYELRLISGQRAVAPRLILEHLALVLP